ncbi:MAG: LCP family protein [Clostridia bacterium]|nr:LCP family protein [Clostridia bacterium]
MDDIYFSDKDKRRKKSGDEPASSKRIVSDKFLDSDYDDEVFELDFKQKGTSQPFPEKKGNFKVDIPDFDIDIPEPGHIEAPNHNIYSSTPSRTPQGRRVTPGTVHRVQPSTASPQSVNRTPQGARVQGTAPSRPTPQPVVHPTQRPAPHPPVHRTPQGSRPVKKKSGKGKIVLGLLCVLLILAGAVFIYGYSALGGLSYDSSITENAYLDESTLVSDESVRNILFIGSDAREGLGGQRSDSMILFSIDNKNHKIKLTSFLRDSYVYIPSKGYNTKLNAAFNYGGAQLLMETLEYNFGVEIDEYVMVNYDVFIELVDLLGGITIHDATEAEAKYMRDKVNRPKFKAGTNHLDGRTAMWYCRIRYVDNDFRRTERQRKVLSAIIDKATKTNPFTLVDIVKQILPNISTNIDRNGLLGLGAGALIYMHYDILQQHVPAEGTWSNARINGQDVLKMNFEENKSIIKEFIYE